MGLIEKLEEIKTKLENYSPGGGGGSDFVVSNGYQLFVNGFRLDAYFDILKNTTEITNMYGFFNGANTVTQEHLDRLNDIDFSKCTLFQNAFAFFPGELLKMPELKNAKIGNMSYMFRINTGVPQQLKEFNYVYNTDKCTDISYAFEGCYILNNTDRELPISSTASCTTLYSAFETTRGLRSFTEYDTSKCKQFNYCFSKCYDLEKVDVNLSAVTSNSGTSSMFASCSKLSDIKFTGTTTVKCNIDISSTAIKRDKLMEMLETLPVITTTKTITIGSSKMALLSDEDKAEFAARGFTLA